MLIRKFQSAYSFTDTGAAKLQQNKTNYANLLIWYTVLLSLPVIWDGHRKKIMLKLYKYCNIEINYL